ncbi:bidirectional sugar transporter SWEET7-like isoform X3 [Nicotiana tabacum]|uniref:Bidirectional sugar transporter SWEET7-like isoform X3 n=1 Tax=Nicotiana tabacum TaxID=4097 RepID=A0A1S3ZM94_TOBAC|nr:PREDICTED: bidirectional sugar transporter SWEET7-like isoform X3 [Nicotiana tabacum]
MVFNKEIARFAFGVIGNIISLILFLSPFFNSEQANICSNKEEEICRTVLSSSIPCYIHKLWPLGTLWNSTSTSTQHLGCDYKWHRICNRGSAIVGSICIAGNILMYASPLAIMKLVITTKSVEFMPFFLSLFSFLNGVSWTTYALIPLDAFVLAPNSMGIALGLAQLLLYAMYYKSTKRQNAGRKAEEELDLTEQTGSSVTRKTSNSAGV